jgi:hypothetical protein
MHPTIPAHYQDTTPDIGTGIGINKRYIGQSLLVKVDSGSPTGLEELTEVTSTKASILMVLKR